VTDAAHVVSREVTIVNPQGLHARPAALLVRAANAFEAGVVLWIDDREADLKSVMEVMMLASPRGTKGRVEGRGPDAEDAIKAIVGLFANGFGEAYD